MIRFYIFWQQSEIIGLALVIFMIYLKFERLHHDIKKYGGQMGVLAFEWSLEN